jgi:anhydro-N-acetylmuramic acid kinase
LLYKAGLVASAIDLLGFHGQTVLHDPARQLTLQIGDAQVLARRTGIDVVFDFRSADVAAGGQGAPFVPLYHKARTRHLAPPLVVLNLGGVGNLTYVGPDLELLAFDTGPGNALIDDWVHRHTGAVCDHDGRIAATGRVDHHALNQLLSHPYFAITPPKSLDRNSFPIDAMAHLGLEDGAATLVAFTVHSVKRAFDHLPACPQRVLVTGGGRHNPVVMAMLAQALGVDVAPVEAEGLQGDTMEAEAFAYLAARSVMGLALSLPGTTGVPHPMPGGRFARANAG